MNSIEPTSLASHYKLDDRCIRILNPPSEYGRFELTYFFKYFELDGPEAIQPIIVPEVSKQIYIVRFATSHEAARAMREKKGRTLKDEKVRFLRYR